MEKMGGKEGLCLELAENGGREGSGVKRRWVSPKKGLKRPKKGSKCPKKRPKCPKRD